MWISIQSNIDAIDSNEDHINKEFIKEIFIEITNFEILIFNSHLFYALIVFQ